MRQNFSLRMMVFEVFSTRVNFQAIFFLVGNEVYIYEEATFLILHHDEVDYLLFDRRRQIDCGPRKEGLRVIFSALVKALIKACNFWVIIDALELFDAQYVLGLFHIRCRRSTRDEKLKLHEA